MKRYFLVISFLLLSFFSVGFVFGDTWQEPVVEVLDLDIDGSPAVFVNATKDFDYIMRVIFLLEFTDNQYNVDNFAGESSPLTNGINILFNEKSLLDNNNLTSLGSFMLPAYDVTILSDETGSTHILSSRLTFAKYAPSGLRMSALRPLAFHVQDDMTVLSSIVQFTVTLEGYKWVSDAVDSGDSNFFYNPVKVLTGIFISWYPVFLIVVGLGVTVLLAKLVYDRIRF